MYKLHQKRSVKQFQRGKDLPPSGRFLQCPLNFAKIQSLTQRLTCISAGETKNGFKEMLTFLCAFGPLIKSCRIILRITVSLRNSEPSSHVRSNMAISHSPGSRAGFYLSQPKTEKEMNHTDMLREVFLSELRLHAYIGT